MFRNHRLNLGSCSCRDGEFTEIPRWVPNTVQRGSGMGRTQGKEWQGPAEQSGESAGYMWKAESCPSAQMETGTPGDQQAPTGRPTTAGLRGLPYQGQQLPMLSEHVSGLIRPCAIFNKATNVTSCRKAGRGLQMVQFRLFALLLAIS